MVDQCRRVDDEVHGVGQALPRRRVQPEVGLALVAGEHLEVAVGHLEVVRQQVGIPAVEGPVEPVAGCGVVPAANQTDHGAAHQLHPLQPVQRQVAAEESGGTGEQHRPDLRARAGQRRRGGQGRSIEEPVQREVAGVRLRCARAVHRGEGGSGTTWLPHGIDVGGERGEVIGRADDHRHRNLDIEDVGQQIGERQRRQGVTPELGEVGVGGDVGRRRAQQRCRGANNRVLHRALAAIAPQRLQLVGLLGRQLGVQRLELVAVPLFQLRPGQLADTGEHPVLGGPRRRLDQEVARYLERLQAAGPRHLVKRLCDS